MGVLITSTNEGLRIFFSHYSSIVEFTQNKLKWEKLNLVVHMNMAVIVFTYCDDCIVSVCCQISDSSSRVDNQSSISWGTIDCKSSIWVLHRCAWNTDTNQIQVVVGWVEWIGLDWGISNSWRCRGDCGISQKQGTCVLAVHIHKTVRESLADHSFTEELRDEWKRTLSKTYYSICSCETPRLVVATSESQAWNASIAQCHCICCKIATCAWSISISIHILASSSRTASGLKVLEWTKNRTWTCVLDEQSY